MPVDGASTSAESHATRPMVLARMSRAASLGEREARGCLRDDQESSVLVEACTIRARQLREGRVIARSAFWRPVRIAGAGMNASPAGWDDDHVRVLTGDPSAIVCATGSHGVLVGARARASPPATMSRGRGTRPSTRSCSASIQRLMRVREYSGSASARAWSRRRPAACSGNRSSRWCRGELMGVKAGLCSLYCVGSTVGVRLCSQTE